MDLKKYLGYTNPWWKDGSPPIEDKLKHKRLFFRQFGSIALNMRLRTSTVLLGPRRVGKTVMLKQLIGQAIRSGRFKYQNVCYADMQRRDLNNISPFALVEALKQRGLPNSPFLVVLDEIQALDDWETDIKYLTDHEKDFWFVVSGSIASALKKRSRETGMGRFTAFNLPLVSFCEYLIFKNIWPSSLPQNSNEARAAQLGQDEIEDLNSFFLDYLDRGGYPAPIFSKEVEEDGYFGMDIIDSDLFGKYANFFGATSEEGLFAIMEHIAINNGKELSIGKLSRDTSISENTLKKYFVFLQSTFLVRLVKRLGPGMRMMQRDTTFKCIMENPSMRSLMLGIETRNDANAGHHIEASTFSQFHAPSKLSRNTHSRHVRYARFKRRKEYEVDMVHTTSSGSVRRLVEIKWTDNPKALNNAAKTLMSRVNCIGPEFRWCVLHHQIHLPRNARQRGCLPANGPILRVAWD